MTNMEKVKKDLLTIVENADVATLEFLLESIYESPIKSENIKDRVLSNVHHLYCIECEDMLKSNGYDCEVDCLTSSDLCAKYREAWYNSEYIEEIK